MVTKKTKVGPVRRGAIAPAPAPTPSPQPGGVESLSAIADEVVRERQQAGTQQQQDQQQQAKVENASANAARAEAVAEIVRLLKPARDMAEEAATAFNALPAGKLESIWSDKKLEAIAEPLIAVLERHGELIGKFVADWGPYLALTGATLMPCIATVKATRAHRAVIEVQAREVKPEGQGNGQQQPS